MTVAVAKASKKVLQLDQQQNLPKKLPPKPPPKITAPGPPTDRGSGRKDEGLLSFLAARGFHLLPGVLNTTYVT